MKHRRDRKVTTLETSLMRGLGLKDVRELDQLLAQPISQEAASRSESPDEEYELAERMYEEGDRRRDAEKRFEALSSSRYIN